MPAKPMIFRPSNTPHDWAVLEEQRRSSRRRSVVDILNMQAAREQATVIADQRAREAENLADYRRGVGESREKELALQKEQLGGDQAARDRQMQSDFLSDIYGRSTPEEREKLTPMFKDVAKERGIDLPEDMIIGEETAEEKRKRAEEGREEVGEQIRVRKDVR